MPDLRTDLTTAIAAISARGWCRATAGNFSCRLAAHPMRILMTPSGIDKGSVRAETLIELDAAGHVLYGLGKSSAEFLLHVAIYECRPDLNAVLHVHTVPDTVLSRRYQKTGEIALEGYEMLKALAGVTTHEYREIVPILENRQDMRPLAEQVRRLMQQQPPIHGFLLAGHGLYTFGQDLNEAMRHLEALEFLFEVRYHEGKE